MVTSSLDKEKGIAILTQAIEAVKETIQKKKVRGKFQETSK